MTREFWFQLVDRERKAVTSADRVNVQADEPQVVHLRDAVFEKVSRALPSTVIAADLTVFGANGVALGSRDSLAHVDESVTLIVQVPQRAESVLEVGSTEMNDQRYDYSKEWLTEFFTKTVEFHLLPFVGSLQDFVTRPLPVKIRAKKKWLDEWKLSRELQENMFVVHDAAPCIAFKRHLFGGRALSPFRSGRTESSYHFMWDVVFRNVLDHMFTRARIDRDSCRGSSTQNKRPDFLFVLDDVCVFRGEEKSPDVGVRVATTELCSKVTWVYGNVPYVFGYAASGSNIDLLALHLKDDGVVTTAPIRSFNFDVQEHVFEAVLAMLNLSLLFPAIVEVCPASGKDEYRDITRSSGLVVRLFPTFVEKKFPDTKCFDRLKQLYGRMEEASVPNVDHLTGMRFKARTLVFEPRGTMTRPLNLLQLFAALRDVLQALVAIHDLGWIHRDIRWSNVINHREGGSWFLIDFTDAATSPQPSTSDYHLSVQEHAPEMFVENGVHTTAVDIWAVGFLIETSNVRWLDFAGRSSFHARLMAEDPTARPSAQDALDDLVALEEAAKKEEEANNELQQGENVRQRRTTSRKRKIADA